MKKIKNRNDLLRWINKNHPKIARLSERSGISRMHLYNILRSQNTDPKFSTILKICRALNIELSVSMIPDDLKSKEKIPHP